MNQYLDNLNFSNPHNVNLQSIECLGCIKEFNKELIISQSNQNYVILTQNHITKMQLVSKTIVAILNAGGGYVLLAKDGIGQSRITDGLHTWEQLNEINQTLNRAIKNIKPFEFNFDARIVPFEDSDFVVRVELLPNK